MFLSESSSIEIVQIIFVLKVQKLNNVGEVKHTYCHSLWAKRTRYIVGIYWKDKGYI